MKIELWINNMSFSWEEDLKTEEHARAVARKFFAVGYWDKNENGTITFYPPSKITRVEITGKEITGK